MIKLQAGLSVLLIILYHVTSQENVNLLSEYERMCQIMKCDWNGFDLIKGVRYHFNLIIIEYSITFEPPKIVLLLKQPNTMKLIMYLLNARHPRNINLE